MLRFILLVAATMAALAQQRFASVARENMRGAAVQGGALYTWGNTLLKWDLGRSSKRVLGSSRAGGFGEGGCVDDRGHVYLQDGVETGPLLSIAATGGIAVWDRKVEMHDCIAAELLSHRGVLITDHYGQVRFYEGPGVYQEVYSFYTPSRQAGLLIADVDGDGLPDIFSGNYWIRSPKEFELPWRLFAINTRHETPDSATMSLAWSGKALYAAQGHMRDGLLLRYTPAADPAQLWTEQIVASGLHFPHALVVSAFGVVVGENNGPRSRVFVVRDDVRVDDMGTTEGVHTAIAVGDRVLTVGRSQITWWTAPRTAAQRRK